MKISIKTSRSTNNKIAVINGRIKVGEVINGTIIPLPNISNVILIKINKLNNA